MSTGEDFNPRLVMDLGPPTEDERIINLLWRFNELAERADLEAEKIKLGPNTPMGLVMTPYKASEAVIEVGAQKIALGHYDALEEGYVIYPEHLSPEETVFWLTRATEERRKMLEAFAQSSSPHTSWADQTHPEILSHLQNEETILSQGGIAFSALSGHRMLAKKADDFIGMDGYTMPRLSLKGGQQNSLYLHLSGAFTEIGGFIKRIPSKDILLAKRAMGAPAENFVAEEGLIDNDELHALIGLVKEIEGLLIKYPNFSAEELSLLMRPIA